MNRNVLTRRNVLGIAGWKNAGKTTLVVKLVGELRRRGYSISTIKHAHHDADIDQEGKDSFRHRQAGAGEVMLITARRWALMHELREEAEPSLADALLLMAPSDLVIVEGFKNEAIPKIEVIGSPSAGESIAAQDKDVIAIAADTPPSPTSLPAFGRDDVLGLADFVARHFGLGTRQAR